MREVGTSFEYDGVTLHVMKALPNDCCSGCYGKDTDDCVRLSDSRFGMQPSQCGTSSHGVVFVQDIPTFVALKLTN